MQTRRAYEAMGCAELRAESILQHTKFNFAGYHNISSAFIFTHLCQFCVTGNCFMSYNNISFQNYTF